MSSLYATKSLGRTWLPPPSSPGASPIQRSKTGRFGPSGSRSSLLESQPFRWESSREQMLSPGSWKTPSSWRWSKFHERILLAGTLVVLGWWFLLRNGSPLQARIRFDGHWESYLNWSHDAEVELELRNATWKDFAYVTYATNLDYLCNSVMMVEALHRLGAKAESVILHSNEWSPDSTLILENGTQTYTSEARLLQKAARLYSAVLQPIPIQRLTDDMTWGDSFTKLLAFNQTQYRRVLALDSDSTILQPMDELFLLPPTPVAMPRAYWLNHELFDAITLITPSTASHQRIQTAIANRLPTDFDMDIMNHVFGDSCMVLPHRPYALVTGEFRKQGPAEHEAYLGEEGEEWDAKSVLEEAKFVHFSDWPLPKPWVPSPREVREALRPNCTREGSMEEDCRDREVWEGLYREFRERRKAICGPELVGWEREADMEVQRLLADPAPSGVADSGAAIEA